MEMRQLRYFISIARCKSFSRASAELRIAQPALSSQIAALEAELETQLFLRHSRGVEITEAGRCLLLRAEEIVEKIEETRSQIKSLGKVSTCEIRLGLPTTITNIIAIPLINAFAETHREIILHIVEGMTGHLDKWIEQEDIDVAILYDRSQGSRPTYSYIGLERLVLIGRTEGSLSQRETVRFSDLLNIPLIHTTRAHQLRRMIDNYSMDMRVPLKFFAEIDSLAQIRTLLYSMNGYSILPESISIEWQTSEIGIWPIVDPELHLKHHLVHSARFQRNPKAAEILDIIIGVVRGMISDGLWPGAILHEAEEDESKTLVDSLIR